MIVLLESIIQLLIKQWAYRTSEFFQYFSCIVENTDFELSRKLDLLSRIGLPGKSRGQLDQKFLNYNPVELVTGLNGRTDKYVKKRTDKCVEKKAYKHEARSCCCSAVLGGSVSFEAALTMNANSFPFNFLHANSCDTLHIWQRRNI